MPDDYLELEAFSYYGDDDVLDLWAEMDDGATIVFRNATSAVRSNGWWSVNHDIANLVRATAYIPDDSVRYFNIVHVNRQKDMEDRNARD